jgi:hypothetical protein
MKKFGIVLILLGAFVGFKALNMDISVPRWNPTLNQYTGERIVNEGLMNDRLSLMMVGGFLFLGGVMAVGFARRRSTKQPQRS